MNAPVFDGLRVIELCQGMAGPLAAQLLADNGADVVKIEPPRGDWARQMPGFAMWNRGKSSVVLDLSVPSDREKALHLIDAADVLVESVRGGVERALGLSRTSLQERCPSLVHLTISGFGPAEKWEQLPAYEGVVAARIGRYLGADHVSGLSEPNRGDRPIFNITPFGSYASACLAVVAIVGALRNRAATGVGTHVDTSLLDGMAASTMRMPFRRDGDQVTPVTDTKSRDLIFRGINLAFLTAECSDGRFIQMCARQPDHYKGWLQATGLGHLLEDPRFANGPVGFQSFADVDELEELIHKAMKERSQAEWIELFSGEYDVGADPFLTREEFLELPDMVLNGRVVEIADPERGRTRQIGPLAVLGSSATTIGRPAPRLGEHQARADERDAARTAPTAEGDQTSGPARPPLEGVTILEAAYFIAGPLSSRVLSELGARVIKIEPPGGDPFRRVDVEFAQMSHGKESIVIDLKHPRAREVMDRLLTKADVLLHSFRPGVPERLGLDYERVHAINPALVYLYAASYGSNGPQSQRPAFHSTPNALCGAGIMQAGRGNPPVDDSYPDPCAGLAVAAAMAIGLHAREQTGVGQYIETTMLAATGYVQSDMLVQYDGRPDVAMPDNGQHGLHALYRLYPCATGWLFVAALQDKEWAALANAVDHPEWLADGRYATSQSRLGHEDSLVEALGEVLRTRSADEWEQHLVAARVPAARADGPTFEQFLVANTPHQPVSHPDFGDYWWRPPSIRFENIQPASPMAAPRLGEHTESLLSELGFTDEVLQAMIESGAVRTAAAQ